MRAGQTGGSARGAGQNATKYRSKVIDAVIDESFISVATERDGGRAHVTDCLADHIAPPEGSHSDVHPRHLQQPPQQLVEFAMRKVGRPRVDLRQRERPVRAPPVLRHEALVKVECHDLWLGARFALFRLLPLLLLWVLGGNDSGRLADKALMLLVACAGVGGGGGGGGGVLRGLLVRGDEACQRGNLAVDELADLDVARPTKRVKSNKEFLKNKRQTKD